MTLSKRDRRALLALAAAAVISLVVWLWPADSGPAPADRPAPVSAALAERRLERLRQVALSMPEREKALKQATEELADREKGMLRVDTAAQAQALILEILRRLGQAQAPPVVFGGVEIGQAKPLGNDYGEVSVAVSFNCRIEQLVNFLADLTAQPELIATGDLRIGAADQKAKTIAVRLTVSGVVPRRLIPEKKGFQF